MIASFDPPEGGGCDSWNVKAHLPVVLRSFFTGSNFKLEIPKLLEDFFLYYLSLHLGHKPWPVDFHFHTCFVYYDCDFSYFSLDSSIFNCLTFPFFQCNILETQLELFYLESL